MSCSVKQSSKRRIAQKGVVYVYIHYGSSCFSKEKWDDIKNAGDSKPSGGLWASPIASDYGWKFFCETENYPFQKDKNFVFSLKEDARVLRIRSEADLANLPIAGRSSLFPNQVYLDLEELKNHYDATELFYCEKASWELPKEVAELYWAVSGWDCDSILVMNPEVLVFH